MSEGNTTSTSQQPASPDATTPAPGQQAASTAAVQDTTRTFTQEDVNRLVAAERRTQEQRFADAVTKAAEFDKLAESNKTELQKATDAAAKAQADAEQARRELARERVARKHGLSDEDTELLTGTEQQMERLAARIAASAPQPGTPKAPPVPGIEKTPETRNIPLAAQIAAAEADGNKNLVATLKAMQLASTPAI